MSFSFVSAIKGVVFGSESLSKLEASIFGAVYEQLPQRLSDLWIKQFSVINKIHRSPDGKEINLYVIAGGKSSFPMELCFTKRDEFKIAVVDLSANNGAVKLRARVWCVNGHVFSIEYKTSFKDFERQAQGDWQVSCHIEIDLNTV